MNRLKITALLFMILISLPLYSAVYEASTLHNSVSRSETVQALFHERWEILETKNFYFDIYGKINWIFDFNVNTINAGTGETEATDLNLVRTYGSMTLALPIGGFREKDDDTDFILAFTMTGFHYGLTKTVEIDRGSAGSETTTDYKHSQFFDDIYAMSVLWRPYLYLHGGIIINNEYEPEEDGTISYSDPTKSTKRAFISSNLLKAFNLQINATEETDLDSLKVFTDITQIAENISVDKKKNIYLPRVTLGYEYIAAYNDDTFDAVWVKTASGKSETMDSSLKDSATLNIFSLKIKQRLSELFTVESYISGQYISEDIYSKADSEKIDVSKLKEFYFLFNVEPYAEADAFRGKIFTGVSWYWDPAIAVHREKGSAYDLWGWVLGSNVEFTHFGMECKVVYNYSQDLKKLVEAADKWSVEGSLFARL